MDRGQERAPYRDAGLPIEERVRDLLARMTIEEKLAQLGCVWSTALLEGERFSEAKAEETLRLGTGHLTRIGGGTLLAPRESARLANAMQKFLVENTRLGIPAIVHEESCAGYMACDATCFPQAIGLAATWQPELIEAMTEVIRTQMRAVGVEHHGLLPIFQGQGSHKERTAMSFNIAFVIFPDVEELDLAGPYEVLGVAAKHVDKDWRVFTVAQERFVKGANGLTIQADYLFEDAPQSDVIVVPGGLGAREGMKNQVLIDYIKRASEAAQYVTSVCTGAFLLHKAGLLTEKRATTHWAQRATLQQMGGVTVADDRWVHDGNVITAAGVSAGIDMALYLLGLLKTPEIARTLQHYIEYYPAPPYADLQPLNVQP